MKLTVSMITMNEENAIAKVVGDIRRVFADAEILVVDSSRDRTPEIAQGLGCRVLRQFPPQGYGPAMDRALREASGDIVLTLDCDDTYPVEAIPSLVQAIDDGADLANAVRVRRRPKAMPLGNFLANRLFGLAGWIFCGLDTPDLHSGMRAYRATMLKAMPWDPQGPALPVELILMAHRSGFRVKDIDIEYRERIGATSLNRLSSTIWTFRRILRMARFRPSVKG